MTGYRRPVFWLDFWQYIDIDLARQPHSSPPGRLSCAALLPSPLARLRKTCRISTIHTRRRRRHGTSDELNKLADLHARGVLSDEEFARAKARVLGADPGAAAPGVSASHVNESVNGLRRSAQRPLAGRRVGGIARATGLDSWVWRLAFTLGVMFCRRWHLHLPAALDLVPED